MNDPARDPDFHVQELEDPQVPGGGESDDGVDFTLVSHCVKIMVMEKTELLKRINVDPDVAGGKPCIRGTRIYVAILLDALAEGLTPEQVLDHYPQLTNDDIRAALAYAGELAQENTWKLAV